jgi:hypothetical protein
MTIVVAEYGIVRRQNRAAAVAENGVDALVGDYLYDDIRTAHFRSGEWMPACVACG